MRALIAPVLVVFTAFSLWVFGRTGFGGFVDQLVAAPAAWQVFGDLSISLLGVLTWLWHDARRLGRTFWPWAIATLLLGSIAPMAYLLTRPAGQKLFG